MHNGLKVKVSCAARYSIFRILCFEGREIILKRSLKKIELSFWCFLGALVKYFYDCLGGKSEVKLWVKGGKGEKGQVN